MPEIFKKVFRDLQINPREFLVSTEDIKMVVSPVFAVFSAFCHHENLENECHGLCSRYDESLELSTLIFLLFKT